MMTTAVQNILQFYEALPELEKREVAAAILRRSSQFDLPLLTDDDFILHAEERFLELDRSES